MIFERQREGEGSSGEMFAILHPRRLRFVYISRSHFQVSPTEIFSTSRAPRRRRRRRRRFLLRLLISASLPGTSSRFFYLSGSLEAASAPAILSDGSQGKNSGPKLLSSSLAPRPGARESSRNVRLSVRQKKYISAREFYFPSRALLFLFLFSSISLLRA